ncbi:uncharacterized protein LOC129770765 [Toxorhynchites rutilus septentrionalis]|uniref:uncharacterized protein LOC129770765 n=1 Tax=Toxorhynchites rutilus septentrionalis TaxID=329112 RepID=UPI00247A4401|nr:uncharacterized protein LOC129770765 [Toxorhynchites rutilus septentrionalis]
MSYQKLYEESFPASLLLEFDELDDGILSPPRLQQPEQISNVPESRSSATTSHTSNTSSGNYSLSTENENGSGSSGSSNIASKYRTSTNKRVNAMKDAKNIGSKPPNRSTNTVNQKRAKSMENLVNSGASHAQSIPFKRQKYSHVKSKVKQFIDEAISQRDRRGLVRHNSLSNTNILGRTLEETDEFDQETNIDTLRAMLRDKNNEIDSLQRHLHFSELQREDEVARVVALKNKIEGIRLEDSKRERERERERKRERELHEKRVLASYLQLNKSLVSVATQTSPEIGPMINFSTFRSEDSFERLLAANASTAPRVKRALQYVMDLEQEELDKNNNHIQRRPDSVTDPKNSPAPHQNQCSVEEDEESPRSEQRLEITVEPIEFAEICHDCARRKKRKYIKKTRLASFFCIKRE